MKKINALLLLALFSMLSASSCQMRKIYTVDSPDSLIQLTVYQQNKELKYNVSFQNQIVIASSALGLSTNQVDFQDIQIIEVNSAETNEQWTPLFGKTSIVSNNYKQLLVKARAKNGWKLNIIFRAYNDGIAFRYEIPSQEGTDSLIITKDNTTFCFPHDYIARAVDNNIESSDFSPKLLSQVKFSKIPMLVSTPNCWVALSEASVFDFSMMYLTNDSASTTMHADIGISDCSLPMKTPWRVIQIGKKAGDLIESNILVNLNEPCKIEDPSWIKPGKAMWDWRNHGDTINGFVYDLNEASYKRLIDFASENTFPYVLFDAGWHSKDGPLFPREDLDIVKIIDYARNKNVHVILYVDRQGLEFNEWDLEEVLKAFRQWGVVGIKYGFLEKEISDRKKFVDATRAIIRTCAKYHMLVDFHDNPIHPGGEERTWPNRIEIEYCHAQQDSRKSFGPDKAVTVPFMNGLLGALDMSNGYYDLEGLQNRQKVDKQGISSTVVGETARCLINYNPLLILPDNGDEYNKKADLFRFIQEMPDAWDDTKVISGDPGKFVVIARRSGKNWFIAGNTNESGRTLSFSLDFLENGDYKMVKYLDAKDSHFQKNKESYEISNAFVTKDEIINITMAPGGGFCMQLKPKG